MKKQKKSINTLRGVITGVVSVFFLIHAIFYQKDKGTL